MITKRGFSVFWCWLCSEVLLYFERPFQSFRTPRKHWLLLFLSTNFDFLWWLCKF